MSRMKDITSKQLFMGKLSYGKDLIEELTRICIKENIQLGRIEALGAVQKACIGYYDQNSREHQFIDLD